ncbi:MAG TPA: GTP cyclohydrolase II [Candidatus Nanoarchaeia archaeon]|nr:GTP cyclohydrolase II [Candidatus Nanoarchaeia archaeon]
MNKNTIKAIVFDFDDTLIQYKEIGLESHKKAAEKLDLRIPTDEEIASQFGKPWEVIIRKLWPRAHPELFKQTYLEIAKEFPRRQIEGASETLKFLKQAGYALHIISSRSRESLITLLSQTGIPKEYFSSIQGSEDLGYEKPSKMIFQVFLERYGLRPDQVVYVGDSVHDLETAKNAEIPFIGVLTGWHKEEHFGNADGILPSVTGLKEYFADRQSELSVVREASSKLPTLYGDFEISVFSVAGQEIVVLSKGKVDDSNVLVRVHSSCFTSETLYSLRCDCREQLMKALKMIQREPAGLLIYLNQEGRGIGLVQKIKAYSLQDKGKDTHDANIELGFEADSRDYLPAAALLKHLKVKSIRLLTNNPEKEEQLKGYGIEVEKAIPLRTKPNEINQKYLETKKLKMNHKL